MIWVINSEEFIDNIIALSYEMPIISNMAFQDSKIELYLKSEVKLQNVKVELLNDSIKFKVYQQQFRWRNISLLSIHMIIMLEDFNIKSSKFYVSFKWKNLRKVWLVSNCDKYLNLNNDLLLHITKLYESGYGYGVIGNKKDFINHFIK